MELLVLKLPTVEKNANWNEWASRKACLVDSNPLLVRRTENFISLNFAESLNGKRDVQHGDSAADSSPSYGEEQANTASLASDDEDDYCDTSDNFVNDQVRRGLEHSLLLNKTLKFIFLVNFLFLVESPSFKKSW